MSAAQFSSKMLKDLKEQRFCRKVWLTQRQLSEDFSWKDKLCSFCELPAWWKTSQTPLLTKIRDFESTETSKIWNLRSQILLSLWAPRIVKIYSKTSFDKIEGVWTLSSFKNLKMQISHFSHAPLVKTIQIRLLTKVSAWTIRKLRKWSQFVPITFFNQHCQTIFFKLMSTLLKNSFHALYRAAPSGARLARTFGLYFINNADWFWLSFATKINKITEEGQNQHCLKNIVQIINFPIR